MTSIRRQLTLFVDQSEAQTIEQIRQEYNPRQFELIKAHITLCREDEIQDLEQVITNLVFLSHVEIVIEFGGVSRFDNGKGVFLPVKAGKDEFQGLRKQVLAGLIKEPRKHDPHITLMHPRNSTCTDEIFQKIELVRFPRMLKFSSVSLIEQKDAERWQVLRSFVFSR